VRPAIPKWQKKYDEKTTNGFCNNAVDKVMKIDQDESKVKTEHAYWLRLIRYIGRIIPSFESIHPSSTERLKRTSS
jgi:hypothetical protein